MVLWAAEHAAKPRKLNIFLRRLNHSNVISTAFFISFQAFFFENFRCQQARTTASYLFEHLVVLLAAERARQSRANTNILTYIDSPFHFHTIFIPFFQFVWPPAGSCC
jgi:hypothetical protein